MTAKSAYLAEQVIRHVLGGPDFTRPATVYLGLYLADPRTGGAEVSGGGYARVAIANTSASWSYASGVVSNLNALAFPVASAGWGVVTHLVILDAATGGNVLYVTTIPVPVDVLTGSTVTIGAGDVLAREE